MRRWRRRTRRDQAAHVCKAGRGGTGNRWRADALPSDAGRMAQVLLILDEVKVAAVLTEVRRVLDRQIGIVSVTDVEVLRPERF